MDDHFDLTAADRRIVLAAMKGEAPADRAAFVDLKRRISASLWNKEVDA